MIFQNISGAYNSHISEQAFNSTHQRVATVKEFVDHNGDLEKLGLNEECRKKLKRFGKAVEEIKQKDPKEITLDEQEQLTKQALEVAEDVLEQKIVSVTGIPSGKMEIIEYTGKDGKNWVAVSFPNPEDQEKKGSKHSFVFVDPESPENTLSDMMTTIPVELSELAVEIRNMKTDLEGYNLGIGRKDFLEAIEDYINATEGAAASYTFETPNEGIQAETIFLKKGENGEKDEFTLPVLLQDGYEPGD